MILYAEIFFFFVIDSKDPIARKMRLRRRRDQEEADQDQAKILKVNSIISLIISSRPINHTNIFAWRNE